MKIFSIGRNRITDRGMSLVELLTVIAIISMLAAITFPAMNAARRKAKETQCMTNLFQVSTAMRAFELDQHKYPDFIAGPVEYKYPSGAIVYNPDVPSPNLGETGTPTMVPLDQSSGTIGSSVVALYPEYIRSVDGLKCPNSDMNGAGQKYTTSDAVEDPMFNQLATMDVTNATRSDARPSYMKDSSDSRYSATPLPYYLYCMSSYDVQLPPGVSAPNYEAHYSTIWSNAAVGTAGLERQLRWRNPPGDTIVSWCSLHRDLNGNTPTTGSFDTVVFADGRTKRVLSSGFVNWTNAWTVPEPN